jgi:hypothetical protein
MSDLVTIIGILAFLALLGFCVRLGGLGPTTDYYDKAMPGQMDPRPKQAQPNKSAGECINESQLRRLKVRGK